MNASQASFRKRRVLPGAVLTLGLLATAVITFLFWDNTRARTDDRRALMTEEIASAIDFRMGTYVQSIEGVRALFQASDEVTTADFDAYVDSLGVLDDLPGMQAVGWNRLVRPDEVAAYEQRMRAQNPLLPDDYNVRPITTDELMVVEYIIPIEGNEQAFGFNILSEERRAAAIGLSLSTDAPAATAPINLVQDEISVPGILVVLPTTKNGDVDGSVVAVFRTEDLLAAAESDIGHTFSVQDVGAVRAETNEAILLSASESDLDTSAQVEIVVYGRRWLVSLGLGNVPDSSPLGLIFGAASGAALAVALAWLLHTTQHAAQTANRKAAVLTQELRDKNHELAVVGSRLERGIRSADILVWESNLTTGATWSSADPEHPEAGIEDTFNERVHPEDRALVDSYPDPAPGETREYEFRLADKHGNYRWMLSRSQGVHREGDQVIIGAHIDITDQQKHTDLVEILNEDLTARNQALRDFTHVASHDLRSPLRAVGTLVGFLRDDLPADLAADAEHHLTRIDERVARMSQLIDDLLVYARAHSKEGHIEMIEVADVVQDILATIEIPNDIVTVVDCDVPTVSISRTPFSMCVRNLIDNAFKHHDKVGGQVAITAHLADGHLHLAVTDNGPGIDAEYLPKIFEPFRRLRTDETTPGSGIGLSVIERATAAHGGRIDVHSVLGEGSTFTISWPLGSTAPLLVAEPDTALA